MREPNVREPSCVTHQTRKDLRIRAREIFGNAATTFSGATVDDGGEARRWSAISAPRRARSQTRVCTMLLGAQLAKGGRIISEATIPKSAQHPSHADLVRRG